MARANVDGSTRRIPVVSYLELDPVRLVPWECLACEARYFDRRNACARCGMTQFRRVEIDSVGTVTSFTIVHVGDGSAALPFVSALVDCGGTTVRANIVGADPSPDSIRVGMPVRLTTWSLGLDENGIDAIAYGFEPDTESEATP